MEEIGERSEERRELPAGTMENILERSRIMSHEEDNGEDTSGDQLDVLTLPGDDLRSKSSVCSEIQVSVCSSCSSTLDVYDSYDQELGEEMPWRFANSRLKKRKELEMEVEGEAEGEGGSVDGDVESTMTRPEDLEARPSRSRLRTGPTDDELDIFFAEAEKEIQIQKRLFLDKYNYDIEKDEPLEGRYEWVRVNP